MSFLEEYTLLEELGQGGFATVYKVRHNELGYIRAIRVLNATITSEQDPTYRKFKEECRLLLRLGNGNHPNIVHIYQPLLRAQKAIVEMDYVDGEDLFHYLERNKNFIPTEDVLRMLREIGSALAYCHYDIYRFSMDREEDDLKDDPNDGSKILLDDKTLRRLVEKYRVIHNDIHSGNIIRREDGSYVLLDFGLAIEGGNVVRSSRRQHGGAPEFKSPEKWEDETVLTTESDIYSFGVVLYELLAGRVPFPFDKKISSYKAEYQLGEAHKSQQPEPIEPLRRALFEATHPNQSYEKDYPDWLEELIMKCLEKNPQDRFHSAKELYEYVMQQIAASATQVKIVEKEVVVEKEVKVVDEKSATTIAQLQQQLKALQRGKWKLFLSILGAILIIGLFTKHCMENDSNPQYEYVDLGLSVYWASYNVGADKSWENGKYFAWGEIYPKLNFSKDTYTEPSHVDNISGDSRYDVAQSLWGGDWRIPTITELNELVEECTWRLGCSNDVYGYFVTGPNGNQIFLPFSGGYSGNVKAQEGKFGGYWSGTNKDKECAYGLGITSKKKPGINSYDWKHMGRSIRPVIDKQ